MTLKRVLCIMVTCVTTLTLMRLNPCRWSCICNYYINKNLCSRFESGSCGFEYQALMAFGSMDGHDSELQVLMALDSGAQAQIICYCF